MFSARAEKYGTWLLPLNALLFLMDLLPWWISHSLPKPNLNAVGLCVQARHVYGLELKEVKWARDQLLINLILKFSDL